jgi:hypothetical protein
VTRKRAWVVVLALAFGLLVPDTGIAQSRRKRGRRAPREATRPAPTQVASQDDSGDADRVRTSERDVGAGKGSQKEKLFDFEGLNFDGTTRMPALLYFLDRANEELQRASLERRSFVPEMVRSVDEESL